MRIKNHSNEAFKDVEFVFDVDGSTVEEVLQNVLNLLQKHSILSQDIQKELDSHLHQSNMIDAIENGVAVIHHQSANIDNVEVIIRTQHELASVTGKDGLPVRFIWLLFGKSKTHKHTAQATEFSNILSDPNLKEQFFKADSADAFVQLYENFVKDEVNFEHHIPAELRPTGRFAGGLINDLKRTSSTYIQDFKDGFNSKSLASIFFLYFACLAPAIAFGGLLEVQTDGAVGVTEMIVATALCGIVYALFSGQPLTILGSTGPVIVFMGLLYPLCIQQSIPYLPTLACIGLWTMVFLIILALIDACSWIRFFTRFTDDTFAALISLIFIYEAVKKMLAGFHVDASGLIPYDKAFLSLLLALGTYYIGTMLSSMRSGVYLRRKTREFLADFGTTIAILLMLFVSLQFKDIDINRLDVPETLEPSSYAISDDVRQEFNISQELGEVIELNPSLLNSSEATVAMSAMSASAKSELNQLKGTSKEAILEKSKKRGWIVNPFDAPMWVFWMSIIPAILLSILLYLDQNITVRLVNHAQYKLQKGAGYHLDLLVVAILVGVCSLLGLPWMVAATVRSLNHVRSLVKVDEKEGVEIITGTVETRTTGLLVHVLVGVSLLLLTFLKLVPMSVLFGLFLYMGITSMKGNQLFERLKLWFMDPLKYPATYYLRAVPAKEVHKYTFIQTLSLAVLWLVKTSAIAILFPLFIAFLVPIRMLLNRVFNHSHLALLDAEEEPDEEQYVELD
jgi:mannitol/fructose-specific phosphotransferase system IIA component (Ntr-type)/uncharacterized membrane protein